MFWFYAIATNNLEKKSQSANSVRFLLIICHKFVWNTSDTSWYATYLKSPHRHLLPREDYLPPPDPLVQADTLSVDAEARESSTDGLIDDVINLTIDDSIWVERAKNMALLVIYTIFCPLHTSEPLTWEEPLSICKLAGGGRLA